MKKNLQSKASKYIQKTRKVLTRIQLPSTLPPLNGSRVNELLDSASRYVADAEFYLSQNQIETALISIVYSEGLLDALKILGLIHFEWPEQ